MKLYNAQLKELGVHLETRIHSTRFKLRLLSRFEEISTYSDKKEVVVAFNYDVGEVFTTAAATNYDDMATSLLKQLPYYGYNKPLQLLVKKRQFFS